MRTPPARLPLAAAALCALAAACGPNEHPMKPPSPPGGRAAAFVAVTVLPMDREVVLPSQTVVIRDGRITAIGPSGAVAIPEDALVIEGQGGYLAPGLADMHVHLYDTEGFPSYLAHGFTTIANLNGSPEMLSWRAEIAAGTLAGPTLYTTGPSLNGYPPGNPTFIALEDPAAARREVAAQKAAGYDFIKVYNTLPLPVYEAILSEAEAQRIPVLGHIPWDAGAERAVAGYQSNIAHMEEIVSAYFEGDADEAERIREITRIVAASGKTVTPNLFTYSDYLRSVADLGGVLADPEVRHASPAAYSEKLPLNNRSIRPDPEAFAAALRKGHALFQKLTLAFSDAGVPLLLGTDTEIFGFAGEAGVLELVELTRAGLSPYQALVAATRAPGEYIAKHAHPDERFGTIAIGGRADLVLLSDNPLDRIENVRRLRGVMLRGRWMPADELAQVREAAARRSAPLRGIVDEIEQLVAGKRYKEAAARLRAAVGENPGVRILALVVLYDYSYRALGSSPAEAVPFLEIAAALYPRACSAHQKLGRARIAAGDRARGLEDLERARALCPDDAVIARLLTRIALREQAPAFDPVGSYTFTASTGRGKRKKDVTGTLRIARAGTGYGGSLETSQMPELPLTEVVAAGHTLWVVATTPEGGEVELPLTVEGESVKGRFIAGFGRNAPLSGKRVAGP